MRFLFFMIIVLGVFLVAIGYGVDGPAEKLSQTLKRDWTSQFDAEMDSTVTAEAESEIAVAESPFQDDPVVSGDDALLATAIEATEEPVFEEVLTKGEDYSRQQLEKHADQAAPAATPEGELSGADRRQLMQEIHESNRDALATLGRVESILRGDKK